MDKQQPTWTNDKENTVTLIVWNVNLMKLVLSPDIEDENCTSFSNFDRIFTAQQYKVLINGSTTVYIQTCQIIHGKLDTQSYILSASFSNLQRNWRVCSVGYFTS